MVGVPKQIVGCLREAHPQDAQGGLGARAPQWCGPKETNALVLILFNILKSSFDVLGDSLVQIRVGGRNET